MSEEARKAAPRIRAELPSLTVEGCIRAFPVTAPVALAAIREGAIEAGLLPAPTNRASPRARGGAEGRGGEELSRRGRRHRAAGASIRSQHTGDLAGR